MVVVQLQRGLIYGPVASRRLGRSLGINLLPWDRKVCTFDCCYCQYGRTRSPGSVAGRLPSVERVVEAVETALGEARALDAITFSGNGEPTMHPEFPSIVSEVRGLRDRLMRSVPVVLLSNSSLCMNEEVRAAISDVDLRIM
ncbi:MAG: radical SAM protein, partial [bacterium]